MSQNLTTLEPGDSSNLGRSVAWGSIGAGVLGLAQWILIVGIANIGDEVDVGQFTLALAVTAPIFLFANMNLIVVQAADARNEWAFGQYLSVRLRLSTLALCAILVLILLGWIGEGGRTVVTTVAAAKFIAVSYTHLTLPTKA